jgi:hypothetical protein
MPGASVKPAGPGLRLIAGKCQAPGLEAPVRWRGSRCFSKLKQLRAVATRYDKRGYMYQATIDVTSIRVWLRDLVP